MTISLHTSGGHRTPSSIFLSYDMWTWMMCPITEAGIKPKQSECWTAFYPVEPLFLTMLSTDTFDLKFKSLRNILSKAVLQLILYPVLTLQIELPEFSTDLRQQLDFLEYVSLQMLTLSQPNCKTTFLRDCLDSISLLKKPNKPSDNSWQNFASRRQQQHQSFNWIYLSKEQFKTHKELTAKIYMTELNFIHSLIFKCFPKHFILLCSLTSTIIRNLSKEAIFFCHRVKRRTRKRSLYTICLI